MVSLSNRSNNYVVNSIFCVINQHFDLNFNFCKFSCRVNKYFLLIKSFDKSFITGMLDQPLLNTVMVIGLSGVQFA